jgi:hypothetical protein
MAGQHRYSPGPTIWTWQDGVRAAWGPEELDVSTIPVPRAWLADPDRPGEESGRLALTDHALGQLVDALAGRWSAELPDDLNPNGMVALLDAAWGGERPWRQVVEDRLRDGGRAPGDLQQYLYELQDSWNHTWMSRHGDYMAWLTDGATTDEDLERWEAAMDEGLYQGQLLEANPGRLGIQEIAHMTVAAVQDLDTAATGRLSDEIRESVIEQVAAQAAAAPPRPEHGDPQVDPAPGARATLEEYQLARERWGWPPQRAGAWAVRRVWLDQEPWLRGDLAPLLAAAQPLPVDPRWAAEARAATTSALLTWVERADQTPERPLPLEVTAARAAHISTSREHHEQQRALKGLRRDLRQAGPWWWPGSWRRRGDLGRRITQREQLVERLGGRLDQAEAALRRAIQQQTVSNQVWDTIHGVTISRGAVAVQELQRREDELLDDYLRDPPGHLLQAIGPPPAEQADRQAWRDQVRHTERARVTDEERELEDRLGTGIEPDQDPAEVLEAEGLVLLPGYGYAVPLEEARELATGAASWSAGEEPDVGVELPE